MTNRAVAVPVLSMLWERCDPDEALASRFGHASSAACARWLARVLPAHWQLEVTGCDRILLSDANALAWVHAPVGPLLVKWTRRADRFEHLAGIADVVGRLDDAGVPVAAPLPTVSGARQPVVDGASMAVMPLVDGSLLDATNEAEVRAAGAALARLHRALGTMPADPRLDGLPRREGDVGDDVRSWLSRPGAGEPPVVRRGRKHLQRLVDGAGPAPSRRQLVHGDVRSANVLCRGGEVTAFLDLEEGRWDDPVVELARSAVLLGTRYHDWGPVTRATRKRWREGYESVQPLAPDQATWFDALVLWQSLLMVPRGADPTGWGAAVDELLR